MGITQHITVTFNLQNSGVPTPGFGLIGILSYKNLWPARSKLYSSANDAIADGFAATSPEVLALQKILGQAIRPPTVAILRGTRPPTQRYALSLPAAPRVGTPYKLNASGEGVTATQVAYTPLADLGFVDADVNVGTDAVHTVAHGMTTGDGPYRVKNVGGALPTGLAADTNYWIIVVDADHYKFATTHANALANVAVDITAAAGGGAHTLLRSANDVVMAQLVDRLNAVPGKNFTAVQIAGAGDTDTLEIDGNVAGAWFSIEVLDTTLITSGQTHADPGIAADLAEIYAADNSSYWLVTNFNSPACVLAAAGSIEAAGKVYLPSIVDTQCENGALGDGDIGDQLKALGYARTQPCYHRKPNELMGPAEAGLLAPKKPGSWTAAYKTLAGVTADTFTAQQLANLDAKRMTYYKSEFQRSFTWEGHVGSTQYNYLDVVVSLDFVLSLLQTRYLGLQLARDKVPYTAQGIAQIEGVFEGVIDLLKGETYNMIAPGTPGSSNDPVPTILFPTIEEIDSATRAARELPNGEITFRLQSAIHHVDVSVVVLF